MLLPSTAKKVDLAKIVSGFLSYTVKINQGKWYNIKNHKRYKKVQQI
jgi:hypothetical protein